MKTSKKIVMSVVALAFVAGCNEGIDPISKESPGEDLTAPVVTINLPFEGQIIQVLEPVIPYDINFEVTDDIEIKSITVSLDGTELAEYTSFIDYRRAVITHTYETLDNGDHTVSVTAEDMSGKTTTGEVNFKKLDPYTAKYPGEILYLPFDGDYLELLTLQSATPAGGPVFVDGKVGKAVSLNANNFSYVLFPGTELAAVDEFALSFWVNADFVDNGSNSIKGILGLVNLSHTTNFWGNIDMFIENGSNPTDGAQIKTHVVSEGTKESWITGGGFLNVMTFFNQWSHHVFTYDKTAHEFRYYINGALIKTQAASWGTDDLIFTGSGKIVFGAVHFMTIPSQTTGSGSQPWASYLTGEMDEIRIFNKSLSDAEVLEIYNDEN